MFTCHTMKELGSENVLNRPLGRSRPSWELAGNNNTEPVSTKLPLLEICFRLSLWFFIYSSEVQSHMKSYKQKKHF